MNRCTPTTSSRQHARAATPSPEGSASRSSTLDERPIELYPDHDKVADDTVAALRAEAGRNPTDRRFNELLGELSRDDRFSSLWARQDVRWHSSDTKRYRTASSERSL